MPASITRSRTWLVTEQELTGSRFPGRRRRIGLPGVPLLWAVPGFILAVAVHFVAVGAGAWYAFTDWNGISASANWIGLDNFREILESDVAQSALWHTLELTAVYVILVNLAGLFLALALNRTLRSRNFLRALFFAPVVLSPLATAYIWRYLFEFNGPLNQLLGALGLETWQRPWLGDPTFALWAVAVVFIWQYAGLAMCFYLAGLQSIPEEVDEAAAIDGASLLLRVRAVTVPLLAPAMTISIAYTTIQGFRIFDTVVGLTNGGPGSATETLTTQLFNQGFAASRFGYGAAFALVLALLISVVSITQIMLLRTREAHV
jgi:raffinose/stachyose/melibiose transport system permease protein